MKIDFDPNAKSGTKHIWATYIPYRNPAFKTYSKEQFAKSSFTYNHSGVLYIWNDETRLWDEVFRVEDGNYPVCEHGGSPDISNHYRSIQTHLYYKWFGKGRESKRVAVCSGCQKIPNRASSFQDWGDSG